jgi:hypothetical protein
LPGSSWVCNAAKDVESILPPAAEETTMNKRKSKRQKSPPGWDEKRFRKVLEHYENQTEDEAFAEGEAAYEAEGQTVMIVPLSWFRRFGSYWDIGAAREDFSNAQNRFRMHLGLL